MKNTKTTYFGKIITDFPDTDRRRLLYPVGKKIQFSKEEYEFGSKTIVIGHGSSLTFDWSDVDFYKKEVTRTEIVTKIYKL